LGRKHRKDKKAAAPRASMRELGQHGMEEDVAATEAAMAAIAEELKYRKCNCKAELAM